MGGMPFYRFYLRGESPTPSDGARLNDDRAAMTYAYGHLEPGGSVSVWDGPRHVAQLWGGRPGAVLARAETVVRVDRARVGSQASDGLSGRRRS